MALVCVLCSHANQLECLAADHACVSIVLVSGSATGDWHLGGGLWFCASSPQLQSRCRGSFWEWRSGSRARPLCVLQEGLRTLCVAYKRLVPEEYEDLCELLQAAKVALQDRDKKLAEAYEQIETGLILLGATAVEDR